MSVVDKVKSVLGLGGSEDELESAGEDTPGDADESESAGEDGLGDADESGAA